MKPILGFVEDPGAANMVVGLAEGLAGFGLEFRLFATGKGAVALAARGEGFSEPPPEIRTTDWSGGVVGTSENRETLGLRLIDQARGAGIPSVGVVDFFANAEFRFRGLGNEALAHAPDVILVPDDLTRTAYLQLGHPEGQVIEVGHPQYDYVLEREAELDREGRDAVRARVFPAVRPGKKIGVFLSEISGGLGDGQFHRSAEYTLLGHPDRPGRTEVVLDELLPALEPWRDSWWFAARPHPHNSDADKRELRERFDGTVEGGDPLEMIYAADAVIGMTTMLLQEAAVMGRPTLSIVPRPAEAHWLPCVVSGVTPCLQKRAEIPKGVERLLTSEGKRFPVTPGSRSRIAGEIARIVGAKCPN